MPDTDRPAAPPVRVVVATPSTELAARVVRRVALRYRDGADAETDRPAHVRAGSGLAWVDTPEGRRIAVVQDDAHFVALVDPADGMALPIALPAGPGGRRQFDDARGTKASKLDLEAIVAVPDPLAGGAPMLLAVGSGATPRREHVVLVRGVAAGAPEVRLVHTPALYAALRAEPAFAGSELNVEGALFLPDDGGVLRLFGRGNGAGRDGALPVNATCDLAWPALHAHLAAPDTAAPPHPTRVTQYALGEVDGVPLGFTDAAPGRDGAVTYTAAAEASADAVQDGPVAGSAVGVVARDGGAARWTALREPDGALLQAKVEGLAPDPGDATRLWVVIDRDAHDVPSELCEVRLAGAWGA
jgi:hypothetical protein